MDTFFVIIEGGVHDGRQTVRYMPELRRQMVALARSGRTAASLSKEFGPSAMTIGTWVKQAARDAGKGDGG